jgi:hypothetical protein
MKRTPVKSDNWSEYEIYPLLVRIEEAQGILPKAEAFLALRVHQAREQKVTWSAIGDVLGMSKQAAQERFGRVEALAN